MKSVKFNPLTSLVVAAALAIGLTACGGGSSTTPDPTPMPDPAIAERMAISSAITAANTAVGMVTDDAADSVVAAADSAIAAAKMAITDAANVPAEERTAHSTTVSTIEAALTTAKASRTAAMNAAAEKMQMEMAAAGRALHGALGSTPLGNLDRTTNAGGAALAASGLTVDQTQGSLAADPAAVELEAGDSAGALGGWSGMNYAHMAAGTKVSNTAVVYTNRGAPMSDEFGDVHTLTDGSLTVDTANPRLVMADAFTHSGTQTHAVPDRADAVYVRGTYDGAPGEYRCPTGCSSTNDGEGSPSALVGTWTFTPDKGAMVSQPDTAYLYFGWWLRKDDGDPTSASAFFGEVGDVEGGGTFADPTGVTGSATYSGHAAGKFAINNPLGGSNAGHFTADVMLTAKFGAIAAPNNGGISGTIDNFMANDESVPWSVALNRAPWGSGGAFATPATDDTATTGVDETQGTVWSIDGNAASASGNWNGQMYDEALAPDAVNDGSNIPTAALGVFQSMFGSTHTMVGAFGANKE